jgi:hypothetical protein
MQGYVNTHIQNQNRIPNFQLHRPTLETDGEGDMGTPERYFLTVMDTNFTLRAAQEKLCRVVLR